MTMSNLALVRTYQSSSSDFDHTRRSPPAGIGFVTVLPAATFMGSERLLPWCRAPRRATNNSRREQSTGNSYPAAVMGS